MKTKNLLHAFAFIAAFASTALSSRAASCCAAETPGEKPAAPSSDTAPAPLPARSLFQLDAKWTTDASRELTLRELRGDTIVAAMIFTHCEYACPMLVQDMRRLRDQLPPAKRDRVRFLLVTFDTERDTPAVLKTYRDAQSLDDRWTLLRGQTSDTQTLAMLLGVQFRRESTGQFGHSNILTVLNPDGEIVHQRTGLQTSLTATAEAIARVTP